jgi:UDP-glucose 4-epimerase
MKVAILGASSFIGSHVARRLISDGAEVSSFVRRKNVTRFDIGTQIEFDFRDVSSFAGLLHSFEVVVHLVSSSNPASSRLDVRNDIQNNLVGSVELLKALEGAVGTRLIFASSGGAVYGIPHSVPISESHSTEPVSPYGVSKLAIEKHINISRLEHGLDYGILRISNPYGPLQLNKNGQGLIPTVIDRAISGNNLTIWGDGSNTRDYIFIEDLVDAFIKAIHYSGDIRLFNIGSGVGSSVLEIVSQVGRLMDREIGVEFMSARKSDPPENVLNVALAKDELGWGAETTLKVGLEKTIDWMLNRKES